MSLISQKQKEKQVMYDSAILLLCVYPKKVKAGIQTNVHSRIIHKSQKMETKHASMDEWINKYGMYVQWYIIQP